ncbi:MAG TPA: serine/threonine-protein kinase [Vicinamibacterales bacterium]|jgi:serine/threonine protein kinase
MAETLGHYKLLERVGAGGLGQVYRARDTKVGRTVLIKLVGTPIAGRPDLRADFLADARRACAVSHPNIAALFDAADEPDGLFLAIEYVHGEPLGRAIGGRPLNPRRSLDIAIQLADGLAEAHALSVLHLDICPANIVLTSRGMTKLLDLGLSTWTNGGKARRAAALALVSGAEVQGTCVPYLSPEQARGEVADELSDVFSLGSVLFEMLTGRLAFPGSTPMDQARGVLNATPPPPSHLNGEVPVELDELVARALAKNREARPASAASLAAELRAVAAVLDIRASEQEPPEVAPPAPESRWPLAVAVIAVAIVLIAWFLFRR